MQVAHGGDRQPALIKEFTIIKGIDLHEAREVGPAFIRLAQFDIGDH